MAPKVPVKIILGTHTIGDLNVEPGLHHFDNAEDVKGLLDAFHNRGYNEIDTASNYLGSEIRLGYAGASSRFTINTKVRASGEAGELKPERVKQSIKQSLDELQVQSVETMYLHLPDRATPFEDTAKAIDEEYRLGKFKRFGLSNFSPDEVQKFIDVCEKHGYVKPTVYQGHYNFIVRGGEKAFFPTLRKNNISFVAFSPAAGGILSGHADTSARWQQGNTIGNYYTGLYRNAAIPDALNTVRNLAEKHGISGHAAAIRWTAFHSVLDGQYGDALIFGVSKLEQLHRNLDALESGPLPSDLADEMSALYRTIEGEDEVPFHL